MDKWGLTAEDRKRVRQFLNKPAYRRTPTDLLPEDNASTGAARGQHRLEDTLVLAREQAADVFHDRRLEILDHLKEHEPDSVSALADELGYDKGLVSRDLQKLASIDVVKYAKEGRMKAPRLKHSHIVIEPVV